MLATEQKVYARALTVREEGMMGETVRVLVVSGAGDAAEGPLRALRQAGYQVEHQQVDGPALQRALGEAPWDLMLGQPTPSSLPDEQLRLIVENVRDVIWLMDMSFRMLWISPSVRRTRGYLPEEVVGLPLDQQITPASLERVRQLAWEHLTPERLANPDVEITAALDVEFYRKDGGLFHGEVVVTVLRDAEGRPVRMLGVTRDISLREQAWAGAPARKAPPAGSRADPRDGSIPGLPSGEV